MSDHKFMNILEDSRSVERKGPEDTNSLFLHQTDMDSMAYKGLLCKIIPMPKQGVILEKE